jgi:DNA-binding NarL/FixJ family response regulator
MEPNLTVCGEMGECRGAIDAVVNARPDAVLLDLSLPDGSGLELIKDLRAAGFTAPVLVLSMHDERLYAERVLRAGANGYLMKEEAPERVVEGIYTVLRGDVFLSSAINRRILKRLAGCDRPEPDGYSLHRLTDREFEVFELIGKGMPSRAIAANLKISTKTVDAHRSHIKEKLGLADGTELVRYAVRWVETGPAGLR